MSPTSSIFITVQPWAGRLCASLFFPRKLLQIPSFNAILDNRKQKDFVSTECGEIRGVKRSNFNLTSTSFDERIRKGHMDIQVGDVVKLKKKHPCGSFEWEVLRIGADFRLKCMGCGHQIMIPRKQVEKNIRQITPAAERGI